MPYRINKLGIKWVGSLNCMNDLTDHQKDLLAYLDYRSKEGETDFIPTRDIAYDLKLHPMAVMGIGHSLVVRGLIEKE